MSASASINAHSEASLTRVTPILSDSKQKMLGYGAACLTVLIWSSYFLSLKFGALSPLGIFDLALFRFCIPGLILTPLLIKRRHRILAAPKLYLLGVMLGAGLPFFLLSAAAMGWAPVADGSTLIPGAAPLFVTGMAVLIFKEPLSVWRRYGLLAVAVGASCFLYSSLSNPSGDLWRGHVLFLFCSAMWAVFTISVRQSGLKPLEAAAVVTVPNAALLLVWALWRQPELAWSSLPMMELTAQMLVQGIGVGLGAGFLYSFAISRLGAEITSAIGSMTPVCATLLAAVLLQESVEFASLLGLGLVTSGVICASGLLNREKA
ncbi:DMT family transporter [Hahella aquimaris]|uniref:DMT family transporter n=1 Tax=Hahella sp. HNIBRBA332 TaxID=3015983 RepID=UPI00273C8D27|nr:DMT family transporter [Hahella sp. HNIBRBA332]WLQ16784.1 DMT family transporter [Hahella sp. HNIBRBA332]